MIDLHLHLLPSVDDGPKDLDQSLLFARALVEAGVDRAVVTPHIDEWTSQVLPNVATVASRTAMLQAQLRAHSIPLRLWPGGECYLSDDLVQRARDRTVPTFGPGDCLLVEMAEQQPLYSGGHVLSQLRLAGVRVLLAHPERYAFVQTRPEVVDELVELGVMMQVTASAFRRSSDSRRGQIAEVLLRRGQVHIVASDGHNDKAVLGMLEGLDRLTELAGEMTVRLLTVENPRALLESTEMIRPAPAPPTPARHFRMPFFKSRP
jgi:protein-tyrosine phosphatase